MVKVSEHSSDVKNHLVFICDVSPPRGPDSAYLERTKDLGVDFISVAYNVGKSVRVDSSAAAYDLKRHTGIETVFNLATRDMNKLALQSHLMGAAALGLENVIVLRGDDFNERELSMVQAVQDFTPTDLIVSIKQLNQGVDYRGVKFRTPTDFCVGATVDLGREVQQEAGLARRKVVAGADFLITQSIYDVTRASQFLESYEALAGEPLTIPVYYGLQVLERDGIIFGDVPQTMKDDLDKGRPGVDIALELLRSFLDQGYANIYLIPPILKGGVRDYEAAGKLVQASKK